MNSYINGKGMGLEKKSYEIETAIVKHGEFFVFVAGAEIPKRSLCGVKYADGKMYPYNAEATDGTEIPRYFSDDGCKANDKVPFMRGGVLWDDRVTDLTVEKKEKMMDLGFRFKKANKGY